MLHSKTSNLEEYVSEEPKRRTSASELFDAIYHGSDGIRSSIKSENTSNTYENTNEFLSKDRNNEHNPRMSSKDASNILSEKNPVMGTNLDKTLVSKNRSLPMTNNRFNKSKMLSSFVKIDTLGVRPKDTEDTSNLKQVSALIEPLGNVTHEIGINASEITETTNLLVKSEKEAVLGKINANGASEDISLRGGRARESGGLEQKHEMNSTNIFSDNTEAKFDSILFGNNDNQTVGTFDPRRKFRTENPTDHVQGTFPTHSINDLVHGMSADDRVRLRTAMVYVNDSRSYVSSIMGVIRYDDKSRSSKYIISWNFCCVRFRKFCFSKRRA